MLIIDDDPDQLAELKERVTALGHRCHVAASGYEGLERLRAYPDIGIVMIDLYMSRLHGVEVLRRLRRELPAGERVQCLLITGYPLVNQAIEGLDLGATNVLVKPVAGAKLRAALSDAAHRYRGEPGAEFPRTGFRRQFESLMEVIQASGRDAPPSRSAEHPYAVLEDVSEDRPVGGRRSDTPVRSAAATPSEAAKDLQAFLTLAARLSSLEGVLGKLKVSAKALRLLAIVVDAEIKGHQMPVSALCLTAEIPQTTGLRYIEELLEAELVKRQPDPHDKRRFFVCLTVQGRARLRDAVAEFPDLETEELL